MIESRWKINDDTKLIIDGWTMEKQQTVEEFDELKSQRTKLYLWWINYIKPKYKKIINETTYSIYEFVIYKSWDTQNNSHHKDWIELTTRQIANYLHIDRLVTGRHLDLLEMIGLIKYDKAKQTSITKRQKPSHIYLCSPNEQVEIEKENANRIKDEMDRPKKHRKKGVPL